MAENSKIEWTESSWNPVVGCTKVSPGCDHCYAETLVNRFAGGNKGFPNTFDVVTLRDDRMLTQPLRWKRGRRIFVNSLSDLFHDDIPLDFIARVFAVMALTPQHTYQVLTKRHARMRSVMRRSDFRTAVDLVLAGWAVGPLSPFKRAALAATEPAGRMGWITWPLPNVWLGVSVEDQQWADIRIPALLDTPAAVRFLSVEPMLGPIELEFVHRYDAQCGGCSGLPSPAHLPSCGTEPGKDWGIGWVIVGAESGHDARPMDVQWARTIKNNCVDAGVPFFLKQYAVNGRKVHVPELDGQQWMQYPKIPPQISSTADTLL